MKTRFIQGLLLLVWGIQVDLIWFAIPMALIIEARHLLNRRWALDQKDFYRVADLTTIALFGIILFLFLNARTYHFITTLIQWLPIIFFPLVIVLAYSTTEKMSMDVIFYSLRKQKAAVEQTLDLDYFLLGLCLLAIGTNTDDYGMFFFPLCLIVLFWSLFPLRSARYRTRIWIVLAILITVFSGLTHLGLRSSHLALKAKSDQWIASWLARRTDPMKAITAIGKVGQLKLNDSILFRIRPIDDAYFPALLHETSYDLPGKLNPIQWTVMERTFQDVAHEEDFSWRFSEYSADEQRAEIYLEFTKARSLIPVPSNLARIHNLPALNLKSSQYGAVQGRDLVASPSFQISYTAANATTLFSPPQEVDSYIPEDYVELMDKIIRRDIYDDREAISFVRQFFADFKYSLYQDSTTMSENPLAYFLLDRKAGHCEYFASATTLLLRQMGIPSRYVLGYSVHEYNKSLGMYIVRQSHAHTWAIAWIAEQWQVIDTTPGTWFGLEAENGNMLQPFIDFIGNYSFMFQLWWSDQKIEDYEVELYIIGGILLIILIWRISTSEQVILNKEDTRGSKNSRSGFQSPFQRVEQHLSSIGLRRGSGELLRNWLVRVKKPELIPFLDLHNQGRFDPRGLSPDESNALDKHITGWLSEQQHVD